MLPKIYAVKVKRIIDSLFIKMIKKKHYSLTPSRVDEGGQTGKKRNRHSVSRMEERKVLGQREERWQAAFIGNLNNPFAFTFAVKEKRAITTRPLVPSPEEILVGEED
ncbi:MAG: hypothetical protein LBE32_01120 [Burkholderiales bacterium]|nr:hypothetical protein [Burkholderiales bacterium]